MTTSRNAPTLSVVMTTYNGHRFIQAQLESLTTQTRRPDELVVCDDGSTDGTLDLVADFQRHAPFPVRIHRNPMRLGYADNFLHGCSLAAGELIALCDQDDVWEADKLERCVATFTENAGVVLAIHSAQVVDDTLRPRGFCKPDYAEPEIVPPRGGQLDFSLPGFAMVFSSELVRTIDWKNRARDYMKAERPLMAHDQWLVFVARSLGRVAHLSDRLVRYRQHDGNTCGAEDASQTVRPTLHRGLNEAMYRQRAEASEYYGRFLQALADQLPPQRGTTMNICGTHYLHQAGTYHIRVGLYEPHTTLSGRIQTYAALWRQGAYRSRRECGLGWRASLKDAAAVVRGGTGRSAPVL